MSVIHMPIHLPLLAAPELSSLDGSTLQGQARLIPADSLPIDLTDHLEDVREGGQHPPYSYSELEAACDHPMDLLVLTDDARCLEVGYLRNTDRRYVFAYLTEDTFSTGGGVKNKVGLFVLPFREGLSKCVSTLADDQDPEDFEPGQYLLHVRTFALCDEADLRDQCGSAGMLSSARVLSWSDVDFFPHYQTGECGEALELRSVWLRVETALRTAYDEDYDGYGQLLP